VRWSLIVAAAVLVVFAKTASAQPAPIVVDADVITYDSVQQIVTAEGNVRATFQRYKLFSDAARVDLGTGVVTATGRVRLIDADGQELRGQTLTFNSRTEQGVLERFDGVLQRRLYIRGERLDVRPERIVTERATLTTCDPRRPLYRVVARRIEIIPNAEIVAHDASLYLGGVRVVTLPRLTISLRPGGDGPSLPSFGVNDVDGYWADYKLRLGLLGATGDLYLKYGTQSGPFALLTLGYRYSGYAISTRLGRTQTNDYRRQYHQLRYDVAEVGVTLASGVRVASVPVAVNAYVTAGWYDEFLSRVGTTRLDGEVWFAAEPIRLSPGLYFTTRGGARFSTYGTGATRSITTFSAFLTYGVDRYTYVGLYYSLVAIQGFTPLSIDVVDPASTIGVYVSRSIPDRYRIEAQVYYNFVYPETRVLASVGVVLTPRWEIGVGFDYNFRTQAFEDLDYALRLICDCIDIAFRYRQIRREFSIEFGLTGFTQRPLAPFVPRTDPPPLLLPEQQP